MDNTSGFVFALVARCARAVALDFAVHTHAPYAPAFELNITFPRYAREVRTADPPFFGLPRISRISLNIKITAGIILFIFHSPRK